MLKYLKENCLVRLAKKSIKNRKKCMRTQNYTLEYDRDKSQQSGIVLTSASIFQLSPFTGTVPRWFFSRQYFRASRRFSHGHGNFVRGFLSREIAQPYFLRVLNIVNMTFGRVVRLLGKNRKNLKIKKLRSSILHWKIKK